MTFTITETYNNIPFRRDLQTAWGFSCYLHELRLMFDTGGVGAILQNNLALLGIRPDDIDTVVLSHDHWDHTGGIKGLIRTNPEITVYAPRAISHETRDILKQAKQLIKVNGFCEIDERVSLTGPLGDEIPEQSLMLNSEGRLFIVTGCAHPHAAEIIHDADKHGRVCGIIGGLHTVNEDDIHALSGLEYVSASHCTEELPAIVRSCRKSFVPGGVGKVHRI